MIRLGLNRLMALTLALTVVAGISGAASAQEVAIGQETRFVIVRHLDVYPRSSHAARSSLDRLGDAAMEACGGSSFSLREVQASVRASACWRDSMAAVLARIDDPRLTAAFHDRRSDHH